MEHSFEEVFQKYRKKIEIASRKYNRMSGIPAPDFVSHLNESLWKSYRSYDETRNCSFDTWVLKRLRQKAIDLMRGREGTYYNRVFATLDGPPPGHHGDSEDASTSSVEMIVDEECNIEEEAIKKKEADKRQLVDFLLESSKIHKDHSTMTAIIEEYRKETSLSMKPNAIVKSLGMHHTKVKRKLESLARHYDVNRFGELSDYLAV